MGRPRFTAAVGLLAGILGCSEDSTAPADSLETIQILGIPATLAAGLTAQGSATGTFTSGATNPLTTGITWSSDDESVAIVDATGLVTGVSEGTVTISATLGSVVGNADLEVTAALLEAIVLGPPDEEIRVTDQLQMVATGHFSDGDDVALDAATLTWSAPGGGATVSVSSEGVVTGQAPGTATVRAAHPSGPFGEVDVTVRDFEDEGTSLAPLAVTGPYRGEVGAGVSYYAFGGLTPGEPYTIEISSIHAAIDAYGYPTLPFQIPGCARIETTGEASCALRAGAGGTVYMIVSSDQSTGSIYTLDVVPGGVVSEGTAGMPIDVTAFLPYEGVVGTLDSYYVVTGLSAGATYTVALTDPTDDVTLLVDADTIWADGDECSGGESGTADETCTYTASPGGEIHIRVFGGLTSAGASYTLDISGGGLVDEGVGSPVDVTGALPYSGQVGLNWSYYFLDGLTDDAVYTIHVDDVTDNVRLLVHSNAAGGADSLECDSDNSGTTAESCAGVAADGELRISVGGFQTAAGSTYTLDVVPGGIPKEGYITAPRDLTGLLPHAGTVNGNASWYVVTGLPASTTVTVTLTGLSDNVDMFVHESSSFAGDYCHTSNLGTADETCSATTTAQGAIYVQVTPAFGVAGVSFTLDVEVP